MATQTGTIRPIAVLVTICVAAGALLGVAHDATAPVIKAAEERRAEETYTALVPQAVEFEELDAHTEGCVAALRAIDDANAPIGFVIVAQAKGYGGQVPVAVSFDNDGMVTSMVVMDNEETPGLGSKATEPDYVNQYVGKSGTELGADDIDFVSGATITSRAVRAAFDTAVQAFEEVR